MTQITVGITTYNRAHFLKAVIECFLAQTKLPDEIIIYDNCSTDNTAEVVKAFQTHAPFIRYFRTPNHQQRCLTNVPPMIREARYPYFLFAEDDDWYHPSFLEKLSRVLDEHPDYAVTMSWFRDHRIFPFTPDEPAPIYEHDYTHLSYRQVYEEMILIKVSAIFLAGLYRTEILKKLTQRGFPEVIRDAETWLGEVALYTRFYSFPEVLLSKYRQPAPVTQRHVYMQEYMTDRPYIKNAWWGFWWSFISPNLSLSRKMLALPGWGKLIWRYKRKIIAELFHL